LFLGELNYLTANAGPTLLRFLLAIALRFLECRSLKCVPSRERQIMDQSAVVSE